MPEVPAQVPGAGPPPGSRLTLLMIRDLPRPETFRFRAAGRTFRARHWSPAAWAATPPGERPAGAQRGERGGWLLVVAE